VSPADALRAWIRRRDGPLTRDLVRTPGRFGLGQVPARLAPEATTTSVCGFCSTGCGLSVHVRAGTAVNLSPDPAHPVNRGLACPKGWEALAPLAAADRATRPLLRSARGVLEPVGWEQALATFTARLRAVQARHGAEAAAFLSTGQIATEEMVYLGALAKLGMGMVHGDGNTRQCMATAVTAYKEAFGFDAPPYTYADFEQSDVIILVGANLCVAHPIMWERIAANPHRPTIVVLDPRATETALAATEHYALAPRSDLPLLYGVARVLIARGWLDHRFIAAHTRGFEAFAAHVAAFDGARVARATGLDAAAVERLAATIHRGRRVSFWWTMGVNQGHEGVRVAQAIINLALMTGNLGRPGTGANSITGQCNAMGSRLFSNTTALFGGRTFTSAADRAAVARILGVDAARIPDRESLAYDEIVAAIRAGRIKALWVVGTNPAHSWIDHADLGRVLGRLDLLVVQDMYTTTETARLADVLLPAAGWGEKDGTFISSERRIGRIRKVRRAPGQALADLQIFRLVAAAWGCADLFAGWRTAEDVFASIRELSRGLPCDLTGIRDYAMLDAHGGVQWPFPEAEAARPPAPERRLFADGRFFHPDGRARFVFEAPRPVPEPPDREFPFVLLTGRGSASQWHTETRTAKSPTLRSLARRELCVEIHPADAAGLGVAAGEEVRVRSRRGAVVARAAVTAVVRPGQVFLPMHHPATNRLTYPAFDPYSRQPSYKHCAVAVEPARAPRKRAGDARRMGAR